MAPIVHCVRHAQGVHNLGRQFYGIQDPDLTELGQQQCLDLRKKFPYHKNVDLLVASPIRRTMYTCLIGFQPETERGLTVIALPEIQETSDNKCDTGSDLPKLKEEFKDQPVDLSRVGEDWNSKKGRWAPTDVALTARAKAARQWLKARPEKEIVMVTHGGFLHHFNQDWEGFDPVVGTGWKNCEFRTYEFVDEEGDNASLKETAESRERRRGAEQPLTETEKTQLEVTQQRTAEEIKAVA
ncbi:putative phosphoglycerate mutase [Xylona heveae TC161]|uniref:Putative phosphoglycerate mutase n=1 Tax=Xylona heveae (strain CBS 132557 / TC161) TaxID=1328760 RepID=A0A165FMK6_XYLHT|nr:putative phosphoglycerate mutase [Xylona heveae TC161]KZF21160.1 putative phosphoglycerate mutase [Xylona heveae TC161]